MPIARFEMPNGQVARFEVPEGTSPEEAQAQVERLVRDQEMTPKDRPTGATALIEGAGQGASFGAMDEIQAGLGALGAKAMDYLGVDEAMGGEYDQSLGEAYSSILEKRRADIKQAKEQRPGYYTGGEIAGGVATGVAGLKTQGGKQLANWMSRGSLPVRAGKGAVTGATTGATYGFGSGEGGAVDRLDSAGRMGASGAIFGAAAPYVGEGLKRGGSAIIREFATALDEFGLLGAKGVKKASMSPEMRRVYDTMRKDFSDEAEFQKALNSYASQKNTTLAQTGERRTASLAEQTALYGKARPVSEEFFETAIADAPDQLKSAIKRNVSKSGNFYDDVNLIVEQGRKRAEPFYQKAYKANQAVESPVISRILKTPAGKDALKNAALRIQNQMGKVAKPDKELGEIARDLLQMDTQGGVGRGLKLKTLDYVKRAMDKQISAGMRSTDANQRQMADDLIDLKKALVGELDNIDKTGAYAKARMISGDYLSNKEAAEQGAKILRMGTEEVDQLVRGFGNAERKSFKIGARKAMNDFIDSVKDGSSAIDFMKKPRVRQNLAKVLTPSEMADLEKRVGATRKLFNLRNRVLGGSPTAYRESLKDDAKREAFDFFRDVTQSGPVGATLRKASSSIMKHIDGLTEDSAEKVAKILFETDPRKRAQIATQLAKIARSDAPQTVRNQAQKQLESYFRYADALRDYKGSGMAGFLFGGTQ